MRRMTSQNATKYSIPAATRVPSVHEPERLTRNTQSHFELGTNRYPLDMTAEHVGKKRVTLVPSIKTDPFAEQAGGDTNPNTLEFLLFAQRTRGNSSACIGFFKRSVVQAVPSCS